MGLQRPEKELQGKKWKLGARFRNILKEELSKLAKQVNWRGRAWMLLRYWAWVVRRVVVFERQWFVQELFYSNGLVILLYWHVLSYSENFKCFRHLNSLKLQDSKEVNEYLKTLMGGGRKFYWVVSKFGAKDSCLVEGSWTQRCSVEGWPFLLILHWTPR